MKKRLLSAFLAVMMVLTMAPMAFAADDDGVKSYDELLTAISSASDKATIKLANDITLTDTLSINKNVTLDGQGHTISGTVPSDKSFISVQIPNDGDFTMTNCVVAPSGEISIHPAINLSVNGKVSVTNCTFGAKSDTAGYMYNGLEFSQTYAMGDTNITGNTFYGGAFRHNCISFYKMAEKANINISDNNFADLNWDTTNAIRVSNYSSANATITLDGNNYRTHGSDSNKDYAGLLIFQIPKNHTDDLTKLNVVVNNLETNFDGQLYYTYDDTKGLISDNEAVFHGDDSIAKYFVAKVGDTYYKTLAAAVAEAKNGDTVTLVKNTDQGFAVPAGLSITFDVNGKKLERNGQDIQNNGTLTICDSTKQGAIISKGAQAIGVGHNSNTTIEYANVKSVEGAVITGYATGATITIKDGVFNASDNAVVAGNGNRTDSTGATRVNSNTINILGGTFNGQIKSEGYVACGIYAPWNDNITVNGGIFNITGGAGIVARAGNVTVNGGEFNTTGNVTGKVGDSRVVVPCAALVFDSAAKYPALTNDSKIQIKDGKFKSDVDTIKVVKDDTDTNSRVVVGSGYFTTDPSAYCVTGKTGVTSDKDGYKYKVGTIEVKDEHKIQTGAKVGDTKADASAIAEDKRPAAQAVGKSVTPTTLTDTTPITADDKAQALTELVKNNKVKLTDDGKIPAGTTVTVVKETYLDVTVTAYDATSNTVSMDITPKYNLIAVAKTGTDEKTVTLKSAQDAKVGSTKVKVTLPDAFKGQKVYINHDNKELYVAKAKADGTVEFTTNGFSPFTFALSNPNVVAEVNGNAYTSFQDAVNAVANGGTIEIVGGNKNYTATISGSSKTFTVKNTLDSDITVKVNNDSKTVGKNNGTQSFTYTKPSSGGSSGSSSGKTTYKVTTSAVNNGGVNASPSSAEKGATITITLSPDKGYKLDKLTVTDGSGKTVSTVKKSDTVYTFTMPASAVKVGVSYVKATETPSETKFNDVSANDWFASAVDYVTGKGMMNGTADNTFSPKANTTRGMVVTVLYRLENQPSTSAASFTDVASGAYYANAVAWANANGIVSGYGSGKFGPNDKVTREQLAAILYRYAQYKKYDVSVGEDTNILSYDDAQSISSYAIPAIQWACGAGVVTGKSGSKLDPKGNATRAEVAAMLMRFCENVK